MLYPASELDPKRIEKIKRAAKYTALKKATNNFAKPATDFVIREVVFGDSAVTDFYDIEPATAIASGIPIWGADASDLTAQQLSEFTKAAERIDDSKWIVFYGFFDQPVEPRSLTGSADAPPSTGSITALEFKRGSSVLDLWITGQLYGYDDVVGISDTPVVFEENEAISISANATEDTEDKFFGLRGYVVEPMGLGHLAPTHSLDIDARTMGVQNAGMLPREQQVNAVLRAGMDPVQEMTREQISRIYERAIRGIYQMIVADGDARNAQEAKEKYYIRPFIAVDEANAADLYGDINLKGVTGGQEEWFEPASVFTAGDLSNIIATGETLNDKNYLALFGLVDRTACSKLLSIAPGDGAANLDFCDVQHMFAYHGMVKGYTERITYYKQNAPLAYKMNVAAATDHNVVPVGLIAEPFGDVVSKT